MTPDVLIRIAMLVIERWGTDALIYPNAAAPTPGVPDNALCVDVDRVWPHECDDDEDCNGCCGEYRTVAWFDILGNLHTPTDTP